MKIAFLTQYYPPEIGAPQARVMETARAWARRGHEVTILTGFPSHPTGVVPRRWQGHVTGEEREPGIRVVRGWLYATRNRGAFRRTLGHLSCALTTFLRGLGRSADVVVATSPPLFTGLAGLALARIRRVPFVLDVRDLWPDAFVDLGLATEGFVVGVFRRIERLLYREADHVVPVTESFATRIAASGGDAARTTVIRNGVDLARFSAPADREAARKAFDVGDRFVLLYLGAHGIAQGLDRLLPAAKEAGPGVLFLFVGEGAEKEKLVAEAARLGLGKVRFLPGVPRERVPEAYAAADAVLVSLKDTPLMKTFLPSKAFEAMGAGKPVIAAVDGEAKALLEAGEGAIVVPPGDPAALSMAVTTLATNAPLCAHLGRLAKKRAAAEFDRDALADRYLRVLEAACARGAR